MYKIAICDDDINFIEYLENKLCYFLSIYEVEYQEYLSGLDFLKSIDKDFTLVFIDYYLGDALGNKIAEKLRQKNDKVIIVFCSGEKSPEASFFKVNPYRYLEKNLSEKDIECELKEIVEHMIKKFKRNKIIVLINGGTMSIDTNSIIYIQKSLRGSDIFFEDDSGEIVKIKSLEHLSTIFDKLEEDRFYYPHSSYVVNMDKIKKINKNEIFLDNNYILTISRSRKKEFLDRYSKYILRKYRR